MKKHHEVAAAEISALVEAAALKFTDIDWESGPRQLVAALETAHECAISGRVQCQRASADNLAGVFWSADNSVETQALNKRWDQLLDSLDHASAEDSLIDARALAAAEADAVREAAADAATHGRWSVDAVRRGSYHTAITHARTAAARERQYGDAPAWGGLEVAIHRLPEYLAEENARGNYAVDCRADSDVFASVGADSQASCTATINALAVKPVDKAAWSARYIATYTREMAVWCGVDL